VCARQALYYSATSSATILFLWHTLFGVLFEVTPYLKVRKTLSCFAS
jgi:hypothetical protein